MKHQGAKVTKKKRKYKKRPAPPPIESREREILDSTIRRVDWWGNVNTQRLRIIRALEDLIESLKAPNLAGNPQAAMELMVASMILFKSTAHTFGYGDKMGDLYRQRLEWLENQAARRGVQ